MNCRGHDALGFHRICHHVLLAFASSEELKKEIGISFAAMASNALISLQINSTEPRSLRYQEFHWKFSIAKEANPM